MFSIKLIKQIIRVLSPTVPEHPWIILRMTDSVWDFYVSLKQSVSQSYGFSSSCVQMWELDHKEGWAPKNLCFRTVVLKDHSWGTLESPLDCKEIKPVHPKENQPWIFIGKTDAEAEAAVLWSPDAKSQFIGKDPDAGKDWWQKEKGAVDNEKVR